MRVERIDGCGYYSDHYWVSTADKTFLMDEGEDWRLNDNYPIAKNIIDFAKMITEKWHWGWVRDDS